MLEAFMDSMKFGLCGCESWQLSNWRVPRRSASCLFEPLESAASEAGANTQ